MSRPMKVIAFVALGALALAGAGWVAKSVLAPGAYVALGPDSLIVALSEPARAGSAAGAVQAASISVEPFYQGSDSSLKEFGNARSDHEAIALAIAECSEAGADPSTWSDATRARLLFELDQHSMHTLHPRAGPTNLVLRPFQIAAISFSDRLSRDRLAYRRELEDSQSRARLYQVLILALGALATISIGVRSMLDRDTHEHIKMAVAVGAILFSAAGTAVSTMSNFDDSQGVSLRDKRTLAQLQQLHWRVASDILEGDERCDKDFTDDEQHKVRAWRERLEAILDSAVENLARPGDLTPPTLPGPARSHADPPGTKEAAR